MPGAFRFGFTLQRCTSVWADASGLIWIKAGIARIATLGSMRYSMDFPARIGFVAWRSENGLTTFTTFSLCDCYSRRWPTRVSALVIRDEGIPCGRGGRAPCSAGLCARGLRRPGRLPVRTRGTVCVSRRM